MKMSIKKYLVIFYCVLFIPLIFVLLGSGYVDTSGFMGGFAAVGYIMVFGLLSFVISSIINLIITNKFIKLNFINDNNVINKKKVFKVVLLNVLFLLILSLIANSMYMQFLLSPLIILVNISVLKGEFFSKKMVYLSIVWLFLIFFLCSSGTKLYFYISEGFVGNQLVTTSWLYSLITTVCLFILSTLPFVVTSFVIVNRNIDKAVTR